MGKEENGVHVDIRPDVLSVEEITQTVACDAAGAITSFVGVTRDHFEGKRVVRLEYEAYDAMARRTLAQIGNEMVDKFGVLKVALVHRTGVVPVGEASVVILVSSVHRQPALRAVEYGIEELKARTAIWKREVYEDGSVWKENMEFERERKVHGCCRGGGKQEEV